MDQETAFRPGTPEVEVEQHLSGLLLGGAKAKIGRALLTNDRVLFFDQKYFDGVAGAAGGALAGLIARKLQERHEAGGPLLELRLSEVTRVSRGKKLLNRDLIVFEAGAAEHRLSDGFRAWNELVRRLLTERHGKRIVDDGPDAWRVAG